MDLVTCSLGQLQLASPSTVDGPINRLPNELIQAILAKFEIPDLFSLRLVCPRWNAVIESIGHTKKSLFLCHDQHWYKATLEGVSKRFFGQVNVKRDFVQLKLSPQVLYLINVSKFGALLVRLFPHVEQLIIKSDMMYHFYFLFDLWPARQITTLSLIDEAVNCFGQSPVEPFALGITSLAPSLKRFDLVGDFHLLLQMISPMFANLEHFSYLSLVSSSEPEMNKLYRHFGSNCTQFWLTVPVWRITDLQQWLNPDLLATVTHLSLHVGEHVEPLCQYIVDNFTALRVLQIESFFIMRQLILTPSLMNILRHLGQLTELQLYNVIVDFGLWSVNGVMSKLKPLSTVQTCTVFFSCGMTVNRDRLAPILAATFPNIQRMTIEMEYDNVIEFLWGINVILI